MHIHHGFRGVGGVVQTIHISSKNRFLNVKTPNSEILIHIYYVFHGGGGGVWKRIQSRTFICIHIAMGNATSIINGLKRKNLRPPSLAFQNLVPCNSLGFH